MNKHINIINKWPDNLQIIIIHIRNNYIIILLLHYNRPNLNTIGHIIHYKITYNHTIMTININIIDWQNCILEIMNPN